MITGIGVHDQVDWVFTITGIRNITRERRLEILDDAEVRWRLERAIERSQARERAHGKAFSRRTVNARLGEGAHREFMHQQSW
jgi:hypothetical protein